MRWLSWISFWMVYILQRHNDEIRSHKERIAEYYGKPAKTGQYRMIQCWRTRYVDMCNYVMQSHRMMWPWCALTSVNGFLWVIRSLIREQVSHLSKSRFLSQIIYRPYFYLFCVFWLTQRFVERGNLHEFDTLYGGERVKNTYAVRLGDLVVTHGDVTDHLIVARIGLRNNRQLILLFLF